MSVIVIVKFPGARVDKFREVYDRHTEMMKGISAEGRSKGAIHHQFVEDENGGPARSGASVGHRAQRCTSADRRPGIPVSQPRLSAHRLGPGGTCAEGSGLEGGVGSEVVDGDVRGWRCGSG